MANPAFLYSFLAAFDPSPRYNRLFSMDERSLKARGFDRAGLERAYISGLGGF